MSIDEMFGWGMHKLEQVIVVLVVFSQIAVIGFGMICGVIIGVNTFFTNLRTCRNRKLIAVCNVAGFLHMLFCCFAILNSAMHTQRDPEGAILCLNIHAVALIADVLMLTVITVYMVYNTAASQPGVTIKWITLTVVSVSGGLLALLSFNEPLLQQIPIVICSGKPSLDMFLTFCQMSISNFVFLSEYLLIYLPLLVLWSTELIQTRTDGCTYSLITY